MKTYMVCFTVRVLVEAPDEESAAEAVELQDPVVGSADELVVISGLEVEYEETYKVDFS